MQHVNIHTISSTVCGNILQNIYFHVISAQMTLPIQHKILQLNNTEFQNQTLET
jgi:hypothetical protein